MGPSRFGSWYCMRSFMIKTAAIVVVVVIAVVHFSRLLAGYGRVG